MWASLMLTFAILADGKGGDTTRLVTLGASKTVTAVADEAPGLFTRVRSTERFMIALIREGYNRSAGFRDLVDVLQQSNVIVFVQPASCAGGRIRSCLVSVNGSRRERHIRINVDTHTSHDWLIATVAHELQHAVEIAEHPEVTNGSGALALYRRIALGRCSEGLSEECETTRALTTETKVLKELNERTTQIGEGGMGQVYRATDTTLGRQVAIKILPDTFASEPDRLARFEREAKTLASLNHPHTTTTARDQSREGSQTIRTWPSSIRVEPIPGS